ncbi:aprataxin, partial [Acrasis kona]
MFPKYQFEFKRPHPSSDFKNAFVKIIRDVNEGAGVESLLYKDDKVIVLYDAFPKARFHCLVIPRDEKIEYLSDLKKEHIPLLEHMKMIGSKLIEHIEGTNDVKSGFKMGFHAIPSIKVLHLHVISQDFVSNHLKKPHHYNSFATDFFILIENVINTLMEQGEYKVDEEKSKKMVDKKEMLCLKTGKVFKSLGQLKPYLQHRNEPNKEFFS